MNPGITVALLVALFVAMSVYGSLTRSPRQQTRKAFTELRLDARIVRVAETGNVLTIEAGPSTVEWEQHADKLAAALNRNQPSIETRDDSSVILRFLPKGPRPEMDALTAWENQPPDAAPNLRAVPIAMDAYGRPYRMSILGTHILVIGATGAGKGSVIWSIVNQLAPAVRDGTVELWGIDPKGGVELGFGEGLFTRLIYNTGDTWEQDLADLLADANQALTERLNVMRGVTRLHEPSKRAPLVVLIIDEFLTLTLGVSDPALKKRIDTDLIKFLSQARAAGMTVVACAQLAQKDALSDKMRDLFPTRVGLRMTDPIQVDMAMGPAARKAGADAHLIPMKKPGVAYVLGETGKPRLVRFPWTPDKQITETAAKYGRGLRLGLPSAAAPVTAHMPAVQAVDVDPEPERPEGKSERVRRLLAEHPDWTQKAIGDAAGASDRYVRMVRDELRAEAGA